MTSFGASQMNTSTGSGNNDIENVNPSVARGSKRKQETSFIWTYMSRIDVDGSQMAKCSFCGKLLNASSRARTSSLRRHVRKCRWEHQTAVDDQTTTSFDQSVGRAKVAKMIVMHDLPLRFVEYTGFREMMNYCQPNFESITRNTLKSEIFKIYNSEREKTLKLLDSLDGRVAITTDMWTSSTRMGYMVVTMHFIDKSWVLHSRIMRFIRVLSPHDVESLGDELMKCLLDWNVDKKLSAITVNNCSINDYMIDKIKHKFSDSMLLGGKLFHMRCCAHILNLVVRDGLKVIADGIEKIRDSVCFWTASSKRIEIFEFVANQLKIKYDKKLTLDCPTRWNSTYFMLSVALMYKDVFVSVQQHEPQYKCLLNDSEWELTIIMVEHLQPFYKLFEYLSGTKCLTTNLVFPMICKMRMTMNKWLLSSNVVIQSMARSMITKFEKYWGDITGIMAIATVLDPRYKMMRIKFHFNKLYNSDANSQLEKVLQLLKELIKEYELENSVETSLIEQVGDSSVVHSIDFSHSDDEEEEYDQYISEQVRSMNKSELERYLGEQVESQSLDFDILKWWKVNEVKYPILAKVAKDILAIPMSIVASKSVFSAGGRFLSPHHSRLHPNTLEALMCAQNWLWAPLRGGIPEEEIYNILDEEEPSLS